MVCIKYLCNKCVKLTVWFLIIDFEYNLPSKHDTTISGWMGINDLHV